MDSLKKSEDQFSGFNVCKLLNVFCEYNNNNNNNTNNVMMRGGALHIQARSQD